MADGRLPPKYLENMQITWEVNFILKGSAQLQPLPWRPFWAWLGESTAISVLMGFDLHEYYYTYQRQATPVVSSIALTLRVNTKSDSFLSQL